MKPNNGSELRYAIIETDNIDVLEKGLISFCNPIKELHFINDISPFISWFLFGDLTNNLSIISDMLSKGNLDSKHSATIQKSLCINANHGISKIISLITPLYERIILMSLINGNNPYIQMTFDFRYRNKLIGTESVVNFLTTKEITPYVVEITWED
jgi:hypothetical protein